MNFLFGLFATPLGYVLHWVYSLIPNYLVAIFVFTLLINIVLFPLGLSSQKNAAERARLAPRLERLQKKYGADQRKMAEKQQQLYEKEGVKMTGGCLPSILRMLVLFSVIAVIYKPLTYVKLMDAEQVAICAEAAEETMLENLKAEYPEDSKDYEKKAKTLSQRFAEKSYYSQLYTMKYLDDCREPIQAALMEKGKLTETEAEAFLDEMEDTKKDFTVLGISLLGVPSETGIRPNWLWLIAILSGLSSLLTSLLSMRYTKMGMTEAQKQAGGCSTSGMMYGMPVFSLIIAFSVPAGVAVYWIFSSLIGLVSTVLLNKIYNPAKIRAQAEIEYAERRRKKAEDKERLKQARLAEQAAWQREENEKRAAKEGRGTVKRTDAGKKTENTAQETPIEGDEDAEDKEE